MGRSRVAEASSLSPQEQKGNPRWISIQTDRSLQMTNTPFCLFPQGHPLAKTLSGFNRGMPGGCRSCQGATPGSSALGSVREPRPNGRPGRMTAYPSSSTPSMIDHIMPSQSAHFTVGTTRRQRMRCLSSLAWPPLL